jgi:hypothetical protein
MSDSERVNGPVHQLGKQGKMDQSIILCSPISGSKCLVMVVAAGTDTIRTYSIEGIHASLVPLLSFSNYIL